MQDVLDRVSPVVERVLPAVQDMTRADNPSLLSKTIRFSLTVLSYFGIYTKTAGGLLHALLYLIVHRWYILSMTVSVVLLLVSAMCLWGYEYMWHWQSKLFSILPNPSTRRRGFVVVIDDEDEDNPTVLSWAKKAGKYFLFVLLWTLFCYANIQLDHAIFWRQYSNARPDHNLELMLVNGLQAAPIMIGAAYTIYQLAPNFYTSDRSDMDTHTNSNHNNNNNNLPPNRDAEAQLQSLLS